MKCCAKNCLNKYSKVNKIKFFGFPNEKKLQKKWLEFCGKSRSAEISRSWKVCEIHFKDDDFIGKYQCDLGKQYFSQYVVNWYGVFSFSLKKLY